MVTQRSRSWSRMIDSHPFRSMSISAPTPQIRLFQIWPWNCKVKVMGEVKVQGHIVPIDAPPFRFTSIGRTIPEICPIKFGLFKNTSEIFKDYLAKQFFIDVTAMTLGECHQNGHRVHFPRSILSLSQISKVLLERFWHEKQKSLRRTWTRTRTRRRKRTENIVLGDLTNM